MGFRANQEREANFTLQSFYVPVLLLLLLLLNLLNLLLLLLLLLSFLPCLPLHRDHGIAMPKMTLHGIAMPKMTLHGIAMPKMTLMISLDVLRHRGTPAPLWYIEARFSHASLLPAVAAYAYEYVYVYSTIYMTHMTYIHN